MKITKFGHSCLLVEENGVRILVDPGVYSTAQNELKNIDAVLITHEHQDHVDIASLKTVLGNNAGARVITNGSVADIFVKEGIKVDLVEDGASTDVKGVTIEGVGKEHALIHSSVPRIKNVGYFIAGRFFYPGDALTIPGRPVEILAMPTAAPWGKVSEFLDYAIAVKPKVCFPVHDAILKDPAFGNRWPSLVLPPAGISFQILELGKEYEF